MVKKDAEFHGKIDFNKKSCLLANEAADFYYLKQTDSFGILIVCYIYIYIYIQ
jgi:hypothetical protein